MKLSFETNHMKRILLSLLLIVVMAPLYAQTINDYNTDKVRSAKITYDENFTPYVNLSLKNISSKAITTLEVTIYYSDPSNSYDIFSTSKESKIVQVSIPPSSTGSVQFKISKGKNNSKPSGYLITKVRYSDGTVCQ